MKFVGTYESYLALCEDARAYDDVLTFMGGLEDARKIAKLLDEVKAAVDGE